MTQEERQLLFKDLCARLPYGVKADGYPWITREYVESISRDRVNLQGTWVNIEDVKPYLRPMSSMSEEEQAEYIRIAFPDKEDGWGNLAYSRIGDFFNSHHLDYRGLIEKWLAIEAPEGMYDDN